MRPETGGAYKFGYAEPCKCSDWVRSKCRIHKVEPNDVRPNFAHRTQDAQRIIHGTHAPTAANSKARQFVVSRLLRRIHVTENFEIDILTAELIGKMKAVFAEMVPAGRKRCNEANSHWSPSRPVTRI